MGTTAKPNATMILYLAILFTFLSRSIYAADDGLTAKAVACGAAMKSSDILPHDVNINNDGSSTQKEDSFPLAQPQKAGTWSTPKLIGGILDTQLKRLYSVEGYHRDGLKSFYELSENQQAEVVNKCAVFLKAAGFKDDASRVATADVKNSGLLSAEVNSMRQPGRDSKGNTSY